MVQALSAISEFRSLLGDAGVLSDPDELRVYECDGFPIAKGRPTAVVFPTETAQVVECVRICNRHGLPIIPRGSGTGLAGGAVAFGEGALITTTRMTRIESIDLDSRVAVVQAGVRNTALTDAVAAEVRRQAAARPDLAGGGNLVFAPDPSSQRASTIGGNAATNAGGISTLKYGVTANHVLGLEMVLADGSVLVTRGGPLYDGIGPDLPGLVCGSEGTLGIITRVWCRLIPKPRSFRTIYAVFRSTVDACQAVTDVIAAGILPTSMEMMDGAMIRVVEDAFHYGFPTDAQALLLLEIDGVEAALDEQIESAVALCRRNGAEGIQQCSDPARRMELWSARKRAFGAIGRISHGYCTQDACVPRSKLPEVVARCVEIGARHGLRISNVFHAGDGNVHPIMLFDEDDPEQVQRTLRCSEEILEYCISVGGTITGEHGVGVEKLHLMRKMFSPPTIDTFQRIKKLFDPGQAVNDGKLIPSDRVEIELIRPVAPGTPGGAL